MESFVRGLFRGVAGLWLLLALQSPAEGKAPPASESERTEVAALRIAHPELQRPLRLLVRAGEMAVVEIDGRAFGLRVASFDPRNATIDVLELERTRAMGEGENPAYQETRMVDRLVVESGRSLSVGGAGFDMTFTTDEVVRAASSAECPATGSGSKNFGPGDQCCIYCRRITTCATCVTTDCGTCCAP